LVGFSANDKLEIIWKEDSGAAPSPMQNSFFGSEGRTDARNKSGKCPTNDFNTSSAGKRVRHPLKPKTETLAGQTGSATYISAEDQPLQILSEMPKRAGPVRANTKPANRR